MMKRTSYKVVFPNLYKCIYKQFGTIKNFSEKAGLSAPAVYDILYGRNSPRYETIRLCIDTTGQTFEWLFKEA